MYDVHDWAEVRRLHYVEGLSKAAVAQKLSMSRTTVHRLLALAEPPLYRRKSSGSQLDEFAEAIAAMLDDDPRAPATVIAQRLRPLGFAGSLTILKDHLRQVRPAFVAARAYQRTSYEPGELALTDWWEPGIRVPVGKGQTREVFGLVTGLPFSAAFRIVFAFSKTVAAFGPSVVGGLQRIGGLPKAMVSGHDACIVASRGGGQVRLVDEVAALYGQLGLKPVVRPAFPQGKGFIERMNEYLETSFLPLRTFAGIDDLQAQVDAWTITVADRRHVRRVGAVVADALAVERFAMRPLPRRWPDTDEHLEVRASSDCFVRVAGVDYSVPPRFAGRRLAVRCSAEQVAVFCDGEPVANHARSWIRADVVVAAVHARELRLARQARRRLAAGDPQVAEPILTAYDTLVG